MNAPKTNCRGTEQAQAIAANLNHIKWVPRYSSGVRELSTEFAVENGADAGLPVEADVHRHSASHPGEELLVCEVEEGVYAPAGPPIVLEAAVEAVECSGFTDEYGEPEEEHSPPTDPKCEVITHVSLELH